MRALLTASIFLALLAAPVSAATLKLKDGTTVTGKATRYDSPSKTLYFRTDAGKDVKYTLDELDGRSVYMLNYSLVPKDDAQKQLAVANFARDIGLYAHAARRYRETLKTDPSLQATVDQELTKLRRLAAEYCMKNAQAAAAKKNISEAERWLTTIIDKLPGEPEAAQARTIIDNYYARTRAEKMAAADAKASEALQKDVEKGKKRFQEMVEKCNKGLQAESRSEAQSLFRAAIVDGNAVLKEIEKIAKKYDSADMREKAEGYRRVVIDQMVETHLHVASQLSVQSDYNGALKACNEALALDPKNERALSERARIEENSSEGIRGRGWL